MDTIKERPILFSGAMVLAILEGRKTQTRRVVKSQPSVFRANDRPGDSFWYFASGEGTGRHFCQQGRILEADLPHKILPVCPYGQPGDRLWVRETWQYADWTDEGYPFVEYRADGIRRICPHIPDDDWAERLTQIWADLSDPDNYAIDRRAADRRWRSAIHLPRWASRLVLEITDLRVQRLHETTCADCVAEGYPQESRPSALIFGDPLDWYKDLWDSINAARGYPWSSNPWVWAVSFRKI